MRTNYIAPETELIEPMKEQPLCVGTRDNETSGTGEGGQTGGGSESGGNGDGTDIGARRHFNLWDEWDE